MCSSDLTIYFERSVSPRSLSVLRWIERERGDTERSKYIVQWLEQRMEQNRREADQREAWLAQGRKQYTQEVCRQTLQINEEFPVHEE